MAKTAKEKTLLEVEGVLLAEYIWDNYEALSKSHGLVGLKSVSAKRIDAFLGMNFERIGSNRLNGILAFQDPFRRSTGARVHLVVGISGLLAEAYADPEVVKPPTEYEDKSHFFLKVVESASETKRPYVGNIHVHIFPCNKEKVTPGDLTKLIQADHGYQNELQQIADYKPFVFIKRENGSYWLPTNAKTMNYLFGKKPTAP